MHIAAGADVAGVQAEVVSRAEPEFTGNRLRTLLHRVREPLDIVRDNISSATGVRPHAAEPPREASVIGILPPLYPEWLGDRSFTEVHSARFPYVVGEMATGIAAPEMVIAAARAGFLGFYGAAGLAPDRVERSIAAIHSALADSTLPWGSNLIHTPAEPGMEDAIAGLYIRHDVRRVSASAFMAVMPSVVRLAVSGLHTDASGAVRRRRFIFAKVSRPETAAQFLSPAPAAILDSLVSKGLITTDEARLAARIPVAEDITIEADSGGHTDNRPLVCLMPVILDLRDRLAAQFGYLRPIRIGAAGGIGTPSAVAAAFSLGAAYVVTGSINQAAVEAATSDAVKAMLAQAEMADVTMAPAADMFEMGVKVQVLKRGTMFAPRAAHLYRLYSEHHSLDALPPAVRAKLESEILRAPIETVWADCETFWREREPAQLERACSDARHKMALILRWYLGNGSRWAIAGDASRRLDYQIWCGPAMGAFNAWTAGSFLADPPNRGVVQIGLNLLEGAAAIARAQQARTYGVNVPASAFTFQPRALA